MTLSHKGATGVNTPITPVSPLHAAALAYAAQGIPVFPCISNAKGLSLANPKDRKKPDCKHGYLDATTDPAQITAWWSEDPERNIGTCPEDSGHAVLDVEKAGRRDWWGLDEDHDWQVNTREIDTPNGGVHLWFKGSLPPTAKTLWPGKDIDTRGQGSYVLLPPSVVDGKRYVLTKDVEPQSLPQWVIDAVTERARKVEAREAAPDVDLDTSLAISVVRSWLKVAEPAIEGKGGDTHTYKIACRVLDFGISSEMAFVMMDAEWNPRCVPPWSADDLRQKINNAAKHRQNAIGSDAPRPMVEVFKDADLTPPALTDPAVEIMWPDMTGGKDPKPHPRSVDNVAYLLERMNVRLRWNEFTAKVEVYGLRGYQDFDDNAVNFILAFAQKVGLGITPDYLNRYLGVVAHRDRYHPVREYLAKLVWDGVPRVDTWLSTYAGADDSPLHREFGRVTLIGAVRRILYPGCKFDYMLVLEGAQNLGKSKLFATLGGDWFTDQLKIGTDAKHTIEVTAGKWIVECPELSGMARREVEQVKAQITTQNDTARAAYARHTATVPRQFIMGGTTNDARYLRDQTGNRRFLPVAVTAIDIEALRRDRDQLWAEAYHRATVGQEMAILTQDVLSAASEAQAARVVEDPFRERLVELLDGRHGYLLKEDVWKALGRPEPASRTSTEATTLTRTMAALGWTPGRRRWNGELEMTYERSVQGVKSPWLHFFGGKFKEIDVGDI